MPDQPKTTDDAKALKQRITELENENARLKAENQSLDTENQKLQEALDAPVEATFSDEDRTVVLDLINTYERLRSDGRIDSRERDELNAQFDAALASLRGIIG